MPTTEAIYQAAVSDVRKPGQTASHLAERILTNRLIYGRRTGQRGQSDKPSAVERLKELFSHLPGDPVAMADDHTSLNNPIGDDQIALIAAMKDKGLIERQEADRVIGLCQSGEMSSSWLASIVDENLAEGFARRLAAQGAISVDNLREIGLLEKGRSASFSTERAHALFDVVLNPDNGSKPGLHPMTYGQLKTLFELAADPQTSLELTGSAARLAKEQGVEGDLPHGLVMSLSEADCCLRANRMYPVVADPIEKSGFRIVEDKSELKTIAPWAMDDDLAVCEVSPSMIDHVRGVFLRSGIDMRAEEAGADAGPEHEGNWLVSVNREKLIEGIGRNGDFERLVEQCSTPEKALGPVDVKVQSSPDPSHDKTRVPTKAEREQDIKRDISKLKKQEEALGGKTRTKGTPSARPANPERGR